MAHRDATLDLMRAAGEPTLPGPRPRRLPRTLLFYVAAALALTVPVSALVSLALPDRSAPADVVSAPDPRTQGERAVDEAMTALSRHPGDAHATAQLASAYLQRARETADPAYYAKADELVGQAIASAPSDPEVLIASASLALSRHDFARALDLGARAVDRAPTRPAAH